MLDSFIARQPILTREGDTLGYELLFRSAQSEDKAIFNNEAEVGSSVLANMLSNFGQQWLLGGKLAFINVAEMTLQSEFVELLDPAHTIFEITPATVPTDALLEKIQELRGDGFRFALDDCAHEPNKASLLPLCSFIKIDCQRTGMLGLVHEVSQYQKSPQTSRAQLIAMKVESADEFSRAKEAGCHYFQGFYFERPQTLVTKSLSPSAAVLLDILNLTRKEADPRLIEDALKKDVATSVKLLRYINSAGFGLRCEITSFRHAVQLLGYHKLTRWILLLLATSNKSAPPALAKSAISRGRFMELLGQGLLPVEDCDNLFLTGTFSFLDGLLGVDLDSILPSLGLPEAVIEALLHHSGPYYLFLLLAMSAERGIPSPKADEAALMGITPDKMAKALLEATSWAETLTSNSN